MIKNISTVDKVARIVVGLGLMGLAAFANMPWGWIGIILVATGFMNFCPVYRMLGLSTAKKSG